MKSDDKVWKSSALALYASGSTVAHTVHSIRVKYALPYRTVLQFLRSANVIRTHAEQQRRKRWQLTCVTCQRGFSGRTPNVLMCDECYDDPTPGVTSKKLQKYAKWRKERHMIKQFGLDNQKLAQLLQDQDNMCGLCNCDLTQTDVTTRQSDACLDHDHATGKARGFLCNRCNLTLGAIEASGGTNWLNRAEQWLKRGT